MTRLPSLKAVHYFDTAARHQSFTLAAAELHVTQSAVSRMVQSLEDELQVRLFSRNGRVISLTPAGLDYHKAISEALERIAQARQRLHEQASSQALNIGVNPAFATRWLVPRLAQFHRQHPRIPINIIGNELERSAGGDQTTIWIRYGTGPWPGYTATELPIEAQLGVVCAPGLLKKYGPLQQPSDVLGKPMLSYTGSSHDLWQDYFAQFQLPVSALDQSRRFQQLLTLAEAAVSGLGFALVPLFLIEPELASGRLVNAFGHSFEFKRKHFVLHRPEDERAPKVQAFKRWLLKAGRTTPAASAPA